MEISTQNIEALLQLQEQQAQLPRRSNNPTQDFEALLNNELTADAQSKVGNPLALQEAQANFFSQLIMEAPKTEAVTNPDMAIFEEAFSQASGTLDMWDKYASILGSSPADSALRDAYSLLEGIDSRIGELRNNAAISNNPELNGLLNELEVLSATEKFKFNRGDYFA